MSQQVGAAGMTAINASFLNVYVNPTEPDDARLAPYFSSPRPSVASNFTGPGADSSITSTKGEVGCTLLDLLLLFAVVRFGLALRAAFCRLRAAPPFRAADALRTLTRFFDRALARFFRLAIVTLPFIVLGANAPVSPRYSITSSAATSRWAGTSIPLP
jgi:hypothetical protein